MSENKRVTLPFLTKVLKPIMDLIHKKADKTELLPITEIAHNELITNEKGEIIWSERTHYFEQGWVSFVEASEYSFVSDSYDRFSYISKSSFPAQVGEKVRVTFFEKEYEVVVYPDYFYTGSFYCIGNLAIISGAEEHNTGEPFFCFDVGSECFFITNISGTSDLKIEFIDKKVHALEEFYIPTTIARKSDILSPDTTLKLKNYPAEAYAVGNAINELDESIDNLESSLNDSIDNLNKALVESADNLTDSLNELKIFTETPKDYISFKDQVNGLIYLVSMRNGILVSTAGIDHLEITTMPTKIEYMHGEYFDPTGMVVTAVCHDGTIREITDYTYTSTYLVEGIAPVEIVYVEASQIYTTTITVTVDTFDAENILSDFEYIENADKTYTITEWKGTYNGETSTEIIIPNYGCILV